MTDLALHRWIVPYFTSASFFPGRPLLRNGLGAPSESSPSASMDGRMTSVCATVGEDDFSRKPPLTLPSRSAKSGVRGDQRRSYGAEIRAVDVFAPPVFQSLARVGVFCHQRLFRISASPRTKLAVPCQLPFLARLGLAICLIKTSGAPQARAPGCRDRCRKSLGQAVRACR